MKSVTSRDNLIFKTAKQLASRKYRDRTGAYIIEGPNLLRDAIDLGIGLRAILVRSGYLAEGKDFAAADLPCDVEVIQLSESLFSELSDTEHSQGIMAIAEKKVYSEEEFFRHVGDGGNVVILDRLQDPGNIGTILRTADAAGYRGVIALKGCTDIYSSKVVRAAAGSVFRMPVLFLETPEEAAGQSHKYGKQLTATCFDTDKWYYDTDIKKNTALIIGNEGNGISSELIALSDRKVKIPMCGTIDSLNAAVAAGILMYEAMRP